MPPDLNDPAARAAYRAELRGVAWPVRWLGVGIALLGVGAALARHWLPHIPVAIPVFLIAVAALHMAAGFVIRTRYHRLRMRG